MVEQTIQFESLTQASYLLQKGDPEGPLYVLLHGYKSYAGKMADSVGPILPRGANVLIPNAPYPLPYRDKQEKLRLSYSWYFFNPDDKKYVIGYEICKSHVKNLVAQLGFEDNPKILIGWSQGGYASVHIAESFNRVIHLVGMGCQFKIENPKWRNDFKIDAIHGSKDEVVSMSEAKSYFEKIPRNFQGEFKEFKEAGHVPSKPMLDWLQTRLNQQKEQSI